LINFLPPFLLGFLALSFQIYLLREFSTHFYGNEITFGFILAAWLLWGGAGSIIASKLKFKSSKLHKAYYLVIILFFLSLIGLRFSRFLMKTLPGEMTGIIPILINSLVLSFIISFPLGILFVFNAHFLRGNLSQVYLLESLGSAIAGLVVYFLLIPTLSNWQGASVVGISAAFLVFFSFGKKKKVIVLISLLFFLLAFGLFDFPTQKIFWKPFNLVESRDTPYGKLQVIKTKELTSLYHNSLHEFSFPDLATSEESVHFALLQNPAAEDVLLIGGGVGGALEQLLKYPRVSVDYVEINPEIIRLSGLFLPENERKILGHKRIQMFYQDGRAFIRKIQKQYDTIILNLPEPTTAQVNRFYTREFFSESKKKLSPQGILSFRISSSENYISPELQSLLASLYFTLKEVFSSVEIVPGATNIFLASSYPLSIEFNKLGQKIMDLNLQNAYINPHLLFSRLDPIRVQWLKEKVTSGSRAINTDFTPISYFYNSVLWGTQFKGFERKIFSFLSQIRSFWLLDFPLLIFLLLFLILWLRGKKESFYLTPLAVMGFTTIIVEIIAIIAFQTFYGYLYHRIALLLAAFMIGLFLGTLVGKSQKNIHFALILLNQFGFLILILLLYAILHIHPPEFIFFIILLLLGSLGGSLFIICNHLFLKEKENYGLGYGLDLLGSFLGALTVSSVLIRLLGLPILLRYLFLLNSFCLLFLFGGLRKLKFS
jgi:spermidine synthase